MMTFFIRKTSDGLTHVQNYVGIYKGQHHVHSEEGFTKWVKEVNPKNIETEQISMCSCGLKAGEVKDYDGIVWNNDTYL